MKNLFYPIFKAIKYTGIVFLFIFHFFEATSQTSTSITIDECYTSAAANYPLVRQKEILSQIRDFNLDNAGKGYLPQISFNGQATYQSEVTRIPFDIPGMEISSLSKDQYKAYIDIYQPLTEGRMIRQQKQWIETKSAIEEKRLEVDMYTLKETVNQVYFGILLIQAQLKQVELLKKDIESGIAKTNAAIVHGIALKSSVDILKAELLKSDQRTIELNANLHGYVDMLALLINQPIDIHTVFQTPLTQPLIKNITRPEIALFEKEKESLIVQNEIISTRKIPKAGLFLQAGYGKPGFNFLKNKFDGYYIGGIRFNWPLSGLYTSRNDQQLIGLNQNAIDVQKETFLFNINLSMAKQESEITKLNELIDVDTQIISLYENMIGSYSAQLENGTITPDEYLIHVNAVDVARQNLVLHNVQLLQAQYHYKTISGN